jgi:hypothetical protein
MREVDERVARWTRSVLRLQPSYWASAPGRCASGGRRGAAHATSRSALAFGIGGATLKRSSLTTPVIRRPGSGGDRCSPTQQKF